MESRVQISGGRWFYEERRGRIDEEMKKQWISKMTPQIGS